VRVIAGSARGRRLAAVPGEGTRPITDRAKEALFAILQLRVPGARVLDLFAGTGAVGIEALSRGAAWCDFVDLAPPALRTIRANLTHTDLGTRARVMRREALAFLAERAEVPYDLVYVAPPQYRGLWRRALEALDARPAWLCPDALVVVQIDPREDEPLDLACLAEIDRRRYGGVCLLFFANRPVATAPGPVARPSGGLLE
jgi:16S rRNA (guanine966-N2)-methyltransferase